MGWHIVERGPYSLVTDVNTGTVMITVAIMTEVGLLFKPVATVKDYQTAVLTIDSALEREAEQQQEQRQQQQEQEQEALLHQQQAQQRQEIEPAIIEGTVIDDAVDEGPAAA